MMNHKAKKIILTIIIITCLTIPVFGSGSTKPITVTSTGPAYIKFNGSTQGQCLIEMATTPTETPSDPYYFGSGNITINGETEAKIEAEGLIANGTATANGNMHVEFNGLTVDFLISSTNATACFENAPSQPYQGDFIVGSDFNEEKPNSTQLRYTGNLTQENGTQSVSGAMAIYSGHESDFSSGNQTFAAIIYGEDNTTIASIIWAQEDNELSFDSTILNAADVFQRSVNIYSVVPSVKTVVSASGECIYGAPTEENETTNLHYANGSLNFNAMALSEANVIYVTENFYLFNDGVYGLGSMHLTLDDNQSLNVDIYTNSSSKGTEGLFESIGNESFIMVGNVFDDESRLLFNGTIQNATGTFDIQGTFLLLSLSTTPTNSTTTNYITETALVDENDKPMLISVWAKYNYSEFENDMNLTAADTFTRTIDLCPSACTTTVSGNEAINADHTGATGARITVDGNQLPAGTEFNITTVNYGSTQPISVTSMPVQGARYFDVRVLQTNGSALSSSVTVQVSLTDSSFTSLSAISYWNGAAWVKASNQQFTAPHTITANIPASALTGTPVMVDFSATPPPTVTPTPTTTPTSTPTSTPSSTATPSETPSVPELSVVVILGLMVLLTVFVVIVRLRMSNKAVNFGSTASHI